MSRIIDWNDNRCHGGLSVFAQVALTRGDRSHTMIDVDAVLQAVARGDVEIANAPPEVRLNVQRMRRGAGEVEPPRIAAAAHIVDGHGELGVQRVEPEDEEGIAMRAGLAALAARFGPRDPMAGAPTFTTSVQESYETLVLE